MTERSRVWLLRLALVVAVALTLANFVLIAFGWLILTARGGQVVFAIVGTVASGLYAASGLLIAGRGRNPIGWLLVIAGISLSLQILSSTYPGVGVLAHPGSLPAPKIVSALLQFTWVTALMPLALVLLFFPSGHLPSRRWRLVVVVAILGTVLGYTFSTLNPVRLNPDTGLAFANPLGLQRFGGEISTILVGIAWADVMAAVACAVALAQRFRHGGPDLRQQIKWLGFVAAGAGVCMLTALVSLVGCHCDQAPVATVAFTAFFMILAFGVPAALALALFKYRLYDLDLIVNKAVLYAMLAAVFTVAYLAIVIGIGTLVGARGNAFLTTVAAVVIAIAFHPIRERLRGFANRVVYGDRATPYQVLSEFSEKVAGTYASEDVLPRMAQILATGTGAAEARVWLHLGNELQPAASWPPGEPSGAIPLSNGDVRGRFPPGEHVAEVRHQGELLGALSVVMPASEPMNPSKESLVRDLAAQAGLVLRNVRLVEDLRASRRRIVSAQDERAKALERNIHDGAQQQLVALSVKQRLVQTLIERDPEKARTMMEDLQSDTVEALENLRDLARGIYPPLLADKGLAAALQAQSRKATIDVSVDADGIGRYPQEVEAAVYFCCLEALQNVSKYAGATKASVRLSIDDGNLRFVVTDEGAGFDPAKTGYGTGLLGMSDRLEAIGGRLEVRSEPGRGTQVMGAVRVGPPADPGAEDRA